MIDPLDQRTLVMFPEAAPVPPTTVVPHASLPKRGADSSGPVAPPPAEGPAYNASVREALRLSGIACAAFDALDAHLAGMAEEWSEEVGVLRAELAGRLRGGG